MHIGRTIAVMLLALAVALSPLSMGIAAAPAQASAAAVTQAMPDCDHHQHMHGAPSTDTQKSADHGTCVTMCGLCSVVVGSDTLIVAYVLAAGSMLTPAHAADNISSLMGSPPFRPPRA